MVRFSQYNGPGLPGAPLYQATRRLTHAEILALPTTPVGPLIRGEPGLLLVPILATARLNSIAAYTNVDAAAGITIGWDAAGGTAAGLTSMAKATIIAVADDLTLLQQAGLAAVLDPTVLGAGLSVIGANAAAGNFTGGNAANFMDVTVYFLAI